MSLVRLEMAKGTSPLVHGLHDVFCNQHARNGSVATAKSFGDGLDIGYHAFLFPCVEGAAAAHAAHDFVEDEKRAVALADGFHCLEVAGYCGDAAERLHMIVSMSATLVYEMSVVYVPRQRLALR